VSSTSSAPDPGQDPLRSRTGRRERQRPVHADAPQPRVRLVVRGRVGEGVEVQQPVPVEPHGREAGRHGQGVLDVRRLAGEQGQVAVNDRDPGHQRAAALRGGIGRAPQDGGRVQAAGDVTRDAAHGALPDRGGEHLAVLGRRIGRRSAPLDGHLHRGEQRSDGCRQRR
jgi:hypothetical protein